MQNASTIAINILVILEIICLVWCKEISTQANVEMQDTGGENAGDTRLSRPVKGTSSGRGMMSDDSHHAGTPKADKPWLGYYDFLITEGSYKFWIVFQLFTVGVLIYSVFAAIYYAKYTINDYENYDDYLYGRSARSIKAVPSTQTAFLGLPVETYLRIFNAISNYGNKQE